jgi:hypothetical protein
MRKRRCFRLLILVLPVGNLMLSIANLMVDARCIATTGGSRLFCFYVIYIFLMFFSTLEVSKNLPDVPRESKCLTLQTLSII